MGQLLLGLLVLLCISKALSFVPVVPDLVHNIPSTDILAAGREAFDALKNAAMPRSGEGAIACGISEALSGSVGAFLSRRTASALKDEKRDDESTKVTTTAAFFGIRGLLRGSLRVLGIPRPLVIIFASVIASAASESAKKRARSVGEDVEEDEDLPVLSGAEIAGDIAKWLCFDITIESLPTEIANVRGLERNALYYGVGSFSGTVGAATKENLDHYYSSSSSSSGREEQGKGAWIKTWEKIPKASVENGVLFMFYAITIDFIDQFLPGTLQEELIFSRWIDTIEGVK